MNNETTQTQNWIIDEDTAGDAVIWRGEEAIATVWLNSETENIAKLIAAAPKLLETLREAYVTILCIKRDEAVSHIPKGLSQDKFNVEYDKADEWAHNHHQVKSIKSAINQATN